MAVDISSLPGGEDTYGGGDTPGPVESDVQAPTMPDFARFIPQTVMTDMRNQETADQWAKGAQENLANTWASLQYQNRDSMVQGAIDGALAQPLPLPEEPAAPPEAPAPEISPVTAEPATNPVVDQFLQGLGGLLDKLQAPPAGTPPDPAQRGQDIEANRPENMPALTGQDVLSGAGQGLQAWQQAGAEHQLAALQAIDPSAEQEDVDALNKIGGDVTGIMIPGGAGKAANMTGASFDAAHPLIQQAAEMAGANANKVAAVLNDGIQMAKLAATKNPDRDLSTAQKAAYAVWKAGGDAAAMAALPEETQAAVAASANTASDIRQGVVRAAQREAGPPLGTKGMTGQTYQPSQETLASLQTPAEGTAPNLATTFAPSQPPVPKGGLPGKLYQPSQATVDSLKAPAEGAAPNLATTFTPSKPPVPTGTAPTGSKITAAEGAALPGGITAEGPPSGLLRHGLSVGGAVGGEILGLQTTDDQDAGYLRVLKALPYAAAGAAAGGLAAHLGNPDMTEAASQTFRGGLLAPRVGIAKSTADVNSVLNAGAIRGAQAALAGDTAEQATKQAIATYYGEAKALPEAASAFWDALKGQGRNMEGIPEQKANDLGNVVSTAGLRTIEAVTEATRVLLENGAKYADDAVHPQFGDAAARAAGATSRLFLGPSEGWMGQAMMSILKPLQKIPGVGGISAPFTTVPSNLLDRMTSATPVLGALNLAGRGVPPLEIALRQAKGVLATGAILNLFGNNIHGAGPQDQQTKAMLPPGWQPWSVQIGGQWIGMHKLPPEAQAYLRAAATVADMQRYGKGTDLSQALYTVGSAVKDTVIFPGIVQLLTNATAGLTEPASQRERALANSISSMTTEFIPWYMRQAAQAERGTIAETSGKSALPASPQASDIIGQDVAAHVRAQLPGAPEQSVPANLTTTGQPLQNPNQGVGAFANPFSPSQPQDDKVLHAFANVGEPIAPVKSTITTTNGKAAVLSGEYERELNELRGQYLSDKLPATGFKDAIKAKDFLTKADEFANKQLERNHPDIKQDAIGKKGQAAQGAQQRAGTVANIWRSAAGESPATPVAPAATSPWGKARAA